MTVRTTHEREISVDAANRIGILLDSIDRIMKTESERLQVEENRAAASRVRRAGEQQTILFPGLPDALRWRVMVLGCSVEDLNLWIRRDDQDGGRWHTLTEIETGVEVGGVEPLDACEAYFRRSP